MIQLFTSLISNLPEKLAYLDPGSGSFILQVILATLLASLFFLKSFWRRVIGVFRRPEKPEESNPKDAPGDKDL
jgi:hypothetical protein